jgi:hypothetical protein
MQSAVNDLLGIHKGVFIDGICEIRTYFEPVLVSNGYLLNINATCVLVIVCAKTQGALR